MQAKMLKTETEKKAQTLYDALCENPGWLFNDEIETLNAQLGLDDVEEGFLMSKRQFDFWAHIMEPYSKESQGLWSFQFHPLSGHMIYGSYVTKVTKTLAFTRKWSLFRWNVNGLFMKDWIYFNNMGFCHVVFCRLDAKNIPEYLERNRYAYDTEYQKVIGTNLTDTHERDFFVGWDEKQQKRVYLCTHVGGGRMYSKDHARPYQPFKYDKSPDIPPETTRATLCLLRDAGGDDNLLSPEYLPRDLFNLVVGMFK